MPKGLATLPDGSVDADYYTINQGIHSDFVAGLKTIMAGAQLPQQTRVSIYIVLYDDVWALRGVVGQSATNCALFITAVQFL